MWTLGCSLNSLNKSSINYQKKIYFLVLPIEARFLKPFSTQSLDSKDPMGQSWQPSKYRRTGVVTKPIVLIAS